MNIRTKILIVLATIFASNLVEAHEQLTFLNNVHSVPLNKDVSFIDLGVTNEDKISNLKTIEKASATVPDYDMYVLSIQWGSKNIEFINTKTF